VGTEAVTGRRAAWYARRGSRRADLLTLLHLPYTLWHLGYVAIGAALASRLDWRVLAGTLLAFAVGLGVSAHALDELNGRPLGTSLSDRALIGLALAGFVVVAALAVAGAAEVSPWVLAWAGAGMVIATAYCLEWAPALHTVVGFGLAWGAFPVLAGYWAQATSLSAAAVIAALAATLLSMTQRTLSTPARFVRRSSGGTTVHFEADVSGWDGDRLLRTWERPLQLLGASVVVLAVAMLVAHL
jgi:hypothetical protein